jgi:hypothetical protein
MKKLIAAAAMAVCCASPVSQSMAQTTQAANGRVNTPHLFGVYDSNKRLIGTAFDYANLVRDFGTGITMLNYSVDGPNISTIFYYTSGDCTGQAYLDTGTLPVRGGFDGANIWVAGPNTHILAQSENFGGQCFSGNTVPLTVGPAIAIDYAGLGWKPPFVLLPHQD